MADGPSAVVQDNPQDMIRRAREMISARGGAMNAENLNRAMQMIHGTREDGTDFNELVEQRGNPTAARTPGSRSATQAQRPIADQPQPPRPIADQPPAPQSVDQMQDMPRPPTAANAPQPAPSIMDRIAAMVGESQPDGGMAPGSTVEARTRANAIPSVDDSTVDRIMSQLPGRNGETPSAVAPSAVAPSGPAVVSPSTGAARADEPDVPGQPDEPETPRQPINLRDELEHTMDSPAFRAVLPMLLGGRGINVVRGAPAAAEAATARVPPGMPPSGGVPPAPAGSVVVPSGGGAPNLGVTLAPRGGGPVGGPPGQAALGFGRGGPPVDPYSTAYRMYPEPGPTVTMQPRIGSDSIPLPRLSGPPGNRLSGPTGPARVGGPGNARRVGSDRGNVGNQQDTASARNRAINEEVRNKLRQQYGTTPSGTSR